MKAVITNNAHRPVEASPETVSAVLRRLDPLRPLRNALEALGLDHLVSIASIDALTTAPSGPVGFTFAWPLPNSGRAHLAWTAKVSAAGDEGSLLSVSVHAGTDDPAAEHRLLCAWPVIGQVAESLTTRLFRAVTELAETLAEDNLLDLPEPLDAARRSGHSGPDRSRPSLLTEAPRVSRGPISTEHGAGGTAPLYASG